MNGVHLNDLVDEYEQVYEPKKIAHYPNGIIDIVTGPVHATTILSVVASSTPLPLPPPKSTARVPSTLHSFSSSLASFSLAAQQTTSLACPMAMLSTMASELTQLQHQLAHSTDQYGGPMPFVLNYEPREYPIPRLFIVLPDSFKDWDPRSFLMNRFRLYFLRECGDDCESGTGHGSTLDQLSITTMGSSTTIPVKNSIHLTRHEGYELLRPTEFFDQYGPYVLGMLRILRID
ncbi:hypothetical protein K457DRAFT_12450 [Linnemannia elongata AG-77]|uniref:Uncharacterized protein n=1 Tax=Linnemannia elongata AG-77 TaxID=1314771 RepID=A0A197KI30_9FUNG|nr:hypothetical protein K457DRAFT_12450 [Linnemannia elongata AG-77]